MAQVTRTPAAAVGASKRIPVPDSVKAIVLGLLLSFLFVADGWITFHNIVEMKGNSFDFYFIWRGTREMAIGRDPYTADIARQIQMAVSDNYVGQTEAPYYFVYPPLLTPLVWPFVAFPFPESVTAWLVSQQICLVMALVLMLRSTQWRPPPMAIAGLIVAWVAFRYSMVALLLGQTTPFILLLLSGAILASRFQHERIAAILFAFAMIKPQLVILTLIGWLGCRLWRRQWLELGVFGTGVVATSLLPFLLVADWIPSFMNASAQYLVYRPSVSALSMLAAIEPRSAAVTFLVAAALLVGYLLWVARKTMDIVPIASLGVLLSLVMFPLASVYDMALALLPWVACLFVLTRRTDITSRLLAIVLCALPVVSWLIITVLPNIVESTGLTFDAVSADKMIVPLTLLFIFVYTERNKMWKVS